MFLGSIGNSTDVLTELVTNGNECISEVFFGKSVFWGPDMFVNDMTSSAAAYKQIKELTMTRLIFR